jgi:hypothetical protein
MEWIRAAFSRFVAAFRRQELDFELDLRVILEARIERQGADF